MPRFEEVAKVTLIGTAKTTNAWERLQNQKKSPESVSTQLAGHTVNLVSLSVGHQERRVSALDKVIRPLPSRKSPIMTPRISID